MPSNPYDCSCASALAMNAARFAGVLAIAENTSCVGGSYTTSPPIREILSPDTRKKKRKKETRTLNAHPPTAHIVFSAGFRVFSACSSAMSSASPPPPRASSAQLPRATAAKEYTMWLYAYGSRSRGRTAGTTLSGTPLHVRLAAPVTGGSLSLSHWEGGRGVRTAAVVPDDVAGRDAAAACREVAQGRAVGLAPGAGGAALGCCAEFVAGMWTTKGRLIWISLVGKGRETDVSPQLGV